MEMIAYGEDALTLWALKEKLHEILTRPNINDNSRLSDCQIIYRPSFGRRGGNKSSQFGEFDFILLSSNRIYLGESKWDNSQEIRNGELHLRDEQILRHSVMGCYIESFLTHRTNEWDELIEYIKEEFSKKGIQKPIAPKNSLLRENLQTILSQISKKYEGKPEVANLLLYFFRKDRSDKPSKVDEGFLLAPIDYSDRVFDNMIRINL